MRPLRLVLALASSVFLIFLLVNVIPFASSTVDPSTDASKGSGLGAYFSFHTPLFPPSAIISLTDDNSTFFLARPAAFGLTLPGAGLSGQLWIGSGFGEDALGRAGISAGAEGELGCSDVPGWDATLGEVKKDKESSPKEKGPLKTPKTQPVGKSTDELVKKYAKASSDDLALNRKNDGTDDHLHAKLQQGSTMYQANDHADIQSIQESAEIAGKVVLLSRGGCGFLEKVMWVQRRGGSALIVGDDVVGGPLVTMYAKGDTSNVSIPALFTSHTTAHLLSSLVPPKGMPFYRLPAGHKSSDGKPIKDDIGKPTEGAIRQNIASASDSANGAAVQKSGYASIQSNTKANEGWFSSFLSAFGLGADNSEIEDHQATSRSVSGYRSTAAESDDFIIGVHDWRDVKPRAAAEKSTGKPSDAAKVKSSKTKQEKIQDLKGGIVAPSSGEYHVMGAAERAALQSTENAKSKKQGWFDSLRWSDEHITDDDLTSHAGERPSGSAGHGNHNDQSPHTGLWVTLRPTTMSASPFFDTLLVLVVSPLVTLTFVYALLLLRSRIRRRRWRAPKSVVERLPVRTYQTVPSDPSSAASTPLEASVTTPLLQSAPRRVLSRASSRTRSRAHTISDIPASSSASPNDHNLDHLSDESEKQESGLAAWRRKYGGKQKECVVCLEEYVDGVSQVMSLPCGHEFHVECITPWLTTRRRTCPICKGDVVRSLNAAQSGRSAGRNEHTTMSTSSSPQLSPASSTTFLRSRSGADHHDSDDEFSTIVYSDDTQTQALLTRNDSPSAALPIPSANLDRDLERGSSRSRSRRPLVRQASDRIQYDHDDENPRDGTFAAAGSWLRRNVFGGWNTIGNWSGRNGAPSSSGRSRGRRRED